MNHKRNLDLEEGHDIAKPQNFAREFVLINVHLNAKTLLSLLYLRSEQATSHNHPIEAYLNQTIKIMMQFLHDLLKLQH